MPQAPREARRIHYEWTGAATSMTHPVILVPGLGGGSKVFGTLPRRFARHGFEVLRAIVCERLRERARRDALHLPSPAPKEREASISNRASDRDRV